MSLSKKGTSCVRPMNNSRGAVDSQRWPCGIIKELYSARATEKKKVRGGGGGGKKKGATRF